MSVSVKYLLHAVQVGATVVGGITEQDLPVEYDVTHEATSGDPYARFVGIRSIKPTQSFTTNAIATALGAISVTGADIAGLVGGVLLYLKKVEDGGAIATGSVHRKYTIAQGILIPQRLTIPHGGTATLQCMVYATYDGNNLPIVAAVNQALPALAETERFTLGPVTIGAVSIAGVKEVEVDFGITVQTDSSDNDIYPTFASIQTILPKITLRGVNPEWFADAAIPLVGLAGTQANTTIYLQKQADGGTLVAANQAQHIKLNAAGLAYLENLGSAKGSDAAEPSIVMVCKHDGTNTPVKATTSSTIT